MASVFWNRSQLPPLRDAGGYAEFVAAYGETCVPLKPETGSDAELDASVLEAVRYNRYRGGTRTDIKSYARIPHNEQIGDEMLDASLSRLCSADQIVRIGDRWLLHRRVFQTAKGRARKPEFQFEDTWILMCILILDENGPCKIRDIIPLADGINKAVPTVDEFHGALNRLLAARLISIHKGAYAPTPKARDLHKKVKENTRSGFWDVLENLMNILRCPCCGVHLKRVTWRIDVTDEEVDAAYKQYLSASSFRQKRKKCQ